MSSDLTRIVFRVDDAGQLWVYHDAGRTVPVVLRQGHQEQTLYVPSNAETKLASSLRPMPDPTAGLPDMDDEPGPWNEIND